MLMMVWVIWSAVRDHLRVRLEVALRGDHVHQLLGDVDVRASSAPDCTRPKPELPAWPRSAWPDAKVSAQLRVAELLQALRVGEVGDARPGPSGCERPLVKRACTMPLLSMSMPIRRPVV